ncbi:MAG: GH92 family glycosyl hydrolase [Prevotella sp.]|nr:GH92 family glycosyl hydrolase [Prevotella sp.]
MKRMKRMFLLLLGLCSVTFVTWAGGGNVGYVNPWIGTGGHGHVFLGANVPFGFVQLGPTEHTRGWDWCSGYHISDSILIGFGHLHLSGTGIGELGDVAFLPVADSRQREVRFSHEEERAEPGFYQIDLHEPEVRVELTATCRVGFHRYSFRGADALLRLDLRQGIGWDRMTRTSIQQESPTVVSGFRYSSGWAEEQRVYFVAEFSQPVSMVEQQGDTVALLRVEDSSRPLLVKCALSSVGVPQAKMNMAVELPHWDFDRVKREASQAWEKELGKVRVEAAPDASADDLVVFYTSLFHTMVAPSVYCDVDGSYRGVRGRVHQVRHVNYTTFSLWDTYRAAHPLMTLIHPEKQADIAMSMLDIFDQQGKLPVWHLMGNETDCMVGNPGVPVLADLVLKGYVEDKERAFKAMRSSVLLDERGMGLLKHYGYLPYDKDSTYETVAKGLEYALADHCVAEVAKMLGHEDDYRYFHQRSLAYQQYFDKKTGFMRGKGADGRFREPFNPFRTIHQHDDYTEGNAWQYTWLVPHDVHGLVSLFGSEERFVEKLDSLFVVEGDLGEGAPPDVSGLIGQYAHGNEPSHHIIYMYDYVGQPWKTARLVRKTMETLYRNDHDGLCGNEDVGQMSAWYVLSAMGLYQVEPAGGKYVIGSPLFSKCEIDVGDGKTFQVVAHQVGKDNIYVQKAVLNGKPLSRSFLSYEEIKQGAVLELFMGSSPSDWGSRIGDRP